MKTATIPELYPFQREGVDWLHLVKGRGLLGDEMGLGKTVQTLHWLKEAQDAFPCIVVCPAGLKWNWLREARLHARLRGEVIEGRTVPKGWLKAKHRLVIINYDVLKKWRKVLVRLRPRTVVFDECHYLQTPNTRRTRAARALALDVPHVIHLSGTPFTNRPRELWPLLNILDPEEYRKPRDFLWRYCGPRRMFFGWNFDGASRTAELHEKLKSVMLRRRKNDVLGQLPPKSRHVVTMDIENRREYERALVDFRGWLREVDPSRLGSASKAEALVKLGYLKRLAAKLKLKSVFEWVDNFLRGCDDKLLLYCVHRSVAHALLDRYKKRAVLVTGEVTGHRRQAAYDRFRADRRVRVLVGNIRAAGTGWSAKGVSSVAFAELDWVPGVHTQAEDRCHGLGRGVAGVRSEAWYLVARGTVEEDLCRLLQRKAKTLDNVLDGGKAPDKFDILRKLLEKLGST